MVNPIASLFRWLDSLPTEDDKTTTRPDDDAFQGTPYAAHIDPSDMDGTEFHGVRHVWTQDDERD